MFRASTKGVNPANRCVVSQTMTEYALILAAVAIVAVVVYMTLGTTITTLLNNVAGCL